MIGPALLAALGLVIMLCARGLSSVRRDRKYKSGTGWCLWRWTDTDSEYILRLHLVKTPWFAVCLHWIQKPDAEPYLHDHPVSFLSIILRGKYAELRQRRGEGSPRIVVRKWFNFIKADSQDRHRIVFARKNTLTLCLMGPKTREWGFHIQGRHVHWKDYYATQRAAKAMSTEFTWPKLNDRIDQLTLDFMAKYDAKVMIDEDVRLISAVFGDFDDEAETSPK